MWLTEPLLTQRLRLRAFTDGDRPAALRLRTDGEVRRYLGGPMSPDDAAAALAQGPAGASWGVFAVADQHTDDVMGSVDLSRDRGELEVSRVFLPEYWGSGFAHEAVDAVIRWAFTQTAAPRIIAVTQTANAASRKLATKLGMTPEATFEQYGAKQIQFALTRHAADRPT